MDVPRIERPAPAPEPVLGPEPEDTPIPSVLFPSRPDDRGAAGTDAAAQANRYRACLHAAAAAPEAAVDESFLWQSEGGGMPAKHCFAVAMVTLGRYDLAAERLADLAEDLRMARGIPADPLGPADLKSLLADIYAQAGNAWLMAGDAARAYTAFSQGLAELPIADPAARADLYVDRARALAASGDYEAAVKDLDSAARLEAGRADVALYLASARRALGLLDAAREAVEAAIERSGEGPAQLLERGNIRLLADDSEGARADWRAVVARWPESAAADAARANLAGLDKRAVEAPGR